MKCYANQSYSSDIVSSSRVVQVALLSVRWADNLTIRQVGFGGSLFNPAVIAFLQNNNPTPADKPKAFVNWLFLDEQFGYKQGNGSGADPVMESEAYPLHERSKILVTHCLQNKADIFIFTLQMKLSEAELAQTIKAINRPLGKVP